MDAGPITARLGDWAERRRQQPAPVEDDILCPLLTDSALRSISAILGGLARGGARHGPLPPEDLPPA